MKRFSAISGFLLTTCLAGCASNGVLTVVEPVGPAPLGASAAGTGGKLQVYSAREPAPIDLNLEEFCANEYGQNASQFEKAHTSYVIYSPSGQVLKKVKNARGIYDQTPALATLPAGAYRIEATAELGDGETIKATLPVVIKAGQTTVVHLEPDWHPAGKTVDPQAVVRADDGRIVGWRVENRTASTRH